MPVTASLGIRETLAPGGARSAVPVRSALVGIILAITVVVGTLTFGANLVRLVTTPQLYGQTWQAAIDTQFQTIPTSFIRASVDHRAGVVAWSSGDIGTVDVMDSHIPAIGLSRGSGPVVGPALVTGRLPTAPDEIALGGSVLRTTNRQVGQVADGAGQRRPAEDAHRGKGGVPRVRPRELHGDGPGSRGGCHGGRPLAAGDVDLGLISVLPGPLRSRSRHRPAR